MIYELAYSWYEDYSPKLFSAPEGVSFDEAQWQSYCDYLLDEAVDKAIQYQYVPLDDGTPRMSWVGWDAIVDAIAEILEVRGWIRLNPVKANYFGTIIIEDAERDTEKLSPEAIEKLVTHNHKVRDEMDREIEND